MKPYPTKSSLIKVMTICFFSLYSLLGAAQPSKEIATLDEFKQWAEAKALCQKTSFTTIETDKVFVNKLQSLNLKIEADVEEIYDDSGLYGGSIKIKTPITLFGFNLKEIGIYGGSGQEFNIVLEASSKDLVSLVKRQQLDKYPANETREDYLHLFFTSQPAENIPWGIDSRGVVIRNTKIENENRIGCWLIDG